MKTQIKFTGSCELNIEHDIDKDSVRVASTGIALEMSDKLDIKKYYRRGKLTAVGCETLQTIFVQALIANIHIASSKGYKDADKMLAEIEYELHRGVKAEKK